MILAAGLGTRLRPLTDSLPKPLLPIAGRPLIVWSLLLLRRYGITEVIVNLHHLGHLIEKELGDGARLGMRVSYSREPVLLGTGGGMKHAASFFQGEAFFVLNGDTLADLDLGAMIARHRTSGAVATLALRDDPDVDRWGAVDTDAEGRVLAITGRGRPRQDGMSIRRMFAGIHVIEPKVLEDLPAGQPSSIIGAYVRRLERGALISGYELKGYWSDIGSIERYEQAKQDADAGRINLRARLSPG